MSGTCDKTHPGHPQSPPPPYSEVDPVPKIGDLLKCKKCSTVSRSSVNLNLVTEIEKKVWVCMSCGCVNRPPGIGNEELTEGKGSDDNMACSASSNPLSEEAMPQVITSEDRSCAAAKIKKKKPKRSEPETPRDKLIKSSLELALGLVWVIFCWPPHGAGY